MTYIHSDSKEIKRFIEDVIGEEKDLKQICEKVLAWFASNISYSRLENPFFPLQRSDLDVLEMRSGTCGDYSNFIVSVLTKMGFETGYAYVHKDCFGDEQDHICTAVSVDERWILIDATNPYRKWHGFDCPHQEYELLSPEEFEKKMKKEEVYWTSVAEKAGKKTAAGLWYAPWIHEEIVLEKDDTLDSVFFLLIMDKNVKSTLYAYYQHYTKNGGIMPCMMIISGDEITYQFSVNEANGIWDNEQWSKGFLLKEIPVKYQTDEWKILCDCVARIKPRVDEILKEI